MKNFSQYIPFHFSIFLSIGIIYGYYNQQAYNYSTMFYITIITFFLLFILWFFSKKKNRFFQVITYTTIFLIGIVSIKSHLSKSKTIDLSQSKNIPKTIYFQINKKLKSNQYYKKYYIDIIQIDSIHTSYKFLLNYKVEDKNTPLNLGETYVVKTHILPLKSNLNPYNFNYKDYLNKKGITHQIFIDKNALLSIESKTISLPIIGGIIRDKIEKKIGYYNFQPRELSILKALVLGQRLDVSASLKNSYAKAGAIHLLAVSGLHVGILFMILSFVLKPLGFLKKHAYIKTSLIIIILWGYALLTGMSASVVRAVTMFSFIALSRLSNNQKNAVFHALFTSYFILLLVNPLFLFDVGFQMSYTAVLSILLLHSKIYLLIPKSKWKILNKISLLFSVSLAATIGTLPLSLYYFHQFPGLFFVSNIIIIPFIGVIMGSGLLVILMAVTGTLPDTLVHVYSSILFSMNWFIEWIAGQERFIFQNISFSLPSVILSYLLIILGYQLWVNYNKKVFYLFIFAIITFQITLLFEKHQMTLTQELIVFNKSKESLIGVRSGSEITVFHSLDSLTLLNNRFLNSYATHEGIHIKNEKKPIPSVFSYKNKLVLVLDSLNTYQNISFKPDMVLLNNSPKINIERLVETLHPKQIIADASNYKSYIKQWKNMSNKGATNFYYTGEKGAFVLR